MLLLKQMITFFENSDIKRSIMNKNDGTLELIIFVNKNYSKNRYLSILYAKEINITFGLCDYCQKVLRYTILKNWIEIFFKSETGNKINIYLKGKSCHVSWRGAQTVSLTVIH